MKKGGIYKHVGGGLYRVLCYALDYKSLEEVVVLEGIPDGFIWAILRTEFMKKGLDGKSQFQGQLDQVVPEVEAVISDLESTK